MEWGMQEENCWRENFVDNFYKRSSRGYGSNVANSINKDN